MGEYTRIDVAGYVFKIKYRIPYTWCMLFSQETLDPILTITAQSAKDKFKSSGLTLDGFESELELLTGCASKYWKRYREYVVTRDPDGLKEQLRKDGFAEEAEDDSFYPHVIYLLENMEENEGLYELVELYYLLLGLEGTDPDDLIHLDLTDHDYESDILNEARDNFVDVVNSYNYLFKYTVGNDKQEQIILKKIRACKEDQLIETVLVPLLIRMGYQDVKPVSHHGPWEFGQDIRLFHKADDFGARVYYAAQVKAGLIHSDSRKVEGNVARIGDQLEIALNHTFIDPEDNEKKRIDRVMLITSYDVLDTAKEYLHTKFPNRNLVLIDGRKIAELVVKYNLVENILQSIQ